MRGTNNRRNRETNQKPSAVIQGDRAVVVMRCLYYGCIMKAKPTFFADESNVGWERKGEALIQSFVTTTVYFSMPY